MTIVSRVAELIRTDRVDLSERLIDAYVSEPPENQEFIDEIFVLLCGQSLAELIEEAELTGSTEPPQEF